MNGATVAKNAPSLGISLASSATSAVKVSTISLVGCILQSLTSYIVGHFSRNCTNQGAKQDDEPDAYGASNDNDTDASRFSSGAPAKAPSWGGTLETPAAASGGGWGADSGAGGWNSEPSGGW